MIKPTLLLFTVAFAARLALAVALGLGEPAAPGSDEYDYTRYAHNLASGVGYVGPEPGQGLKDVRSAYIPPGTPALYALIFLAAGEHTAALRVVQCVIGAASVVLLLRLGLSLVGRRGAWIAAILFAFYPVAIFQSRELMTETLFVFLLLLLSDLCVAHLAPRPRPIVAVAAGVVMGAALLTRPALLLFLPFFGVWAVVAFGRWKDRLVAALVVVVALAVVMPWSVRCSRLYHRFVLVAPTAWTVMLQGNNRVVATDPKYAGYCLWYTKIPEYEHAFDGLDLVAQEVKAKELLLGWLGANRDKWGTLLRNKAIRFWSPFLKQDNLVRRAAMLASWGGVLVLFAPAFLATLVPDLRNRNPRIWLHLYVLATFAQALVYFALPRYRYPMEPFCIVFAALSLDWVWAAFAERRFSDRPVEGTAEFVAQAAG